MFGKAERLAECGEQSLCHVRRCGSILQVSYQRHELVAAHSRHGAAAGDGAAQPLRHHPQQQVGRTVSQGIVDLLEAVQIHPQDRHLAAAGSGSIQSVLQKFVKVGPVGQAGQGIMVHLEVEPLCNQAVLDPHAEQRDGLPQQFLGLRSARGGPARVDQQHAQHPTGAGDRRPAVQGAIAVRLKLFQQRDGPVLVQQIVHADAARGQCLPNAGEITQRGGVQLPHQDLCQAARMRMARFSVGRQQQGKRQFRFLTGQQVPERG